MRLTDEKRSALQTRGGEIYRTALQENRKLSDNEQTELRNIEMQLDAAEYETLHGEPPTQQATEAQRRFTQPIETRATDRPTLLTREQRLADHLRGSYPAEFDHLSIGRIVRGYFSGEWSGAEAEMRAMASSPTTAGGIMIPTPLAARVIDKARNSSAVFRAGASTVPMSAATLKMARVTQDPTAYWTNEAAAITASDMAFDSITFTARKLAALCVVNNELLEDAANFDSVLEMALGKALGLELDRVALHGSGIAPEPQGLYGASGVNTVTSVGTPTNYAKFIQAIYAVVRDNYNPNAIIYSARTAETIAGFTTGILNDETPLQPIDVWQQLTKVVSNQVSDVLDTGSPVTQTGSAAFVGEFPFLAVGLRSTLRLEVAREGSYDISGTHYSSFQKDQTLFRAVLRADVQLLQPSAFTVMSGITA